MRYSATKTNRNIRPKCKYCGCNKISVQQIPDDRGSVRRRVKCMKPNCGRTHK